MSVEIRVRLVCDNCGAAIDGKVGYKTTWWFESYVDAQKQANEARWMTLPRYGKTRHLCGSCADGKPVASMESGRVEL